MQNGAIESDKKPIVVACLGSSTTAAKGTFDWIGELKKRRQNKQFNFINLGVGGDLAYNALQRLPSVINSHPDKVIIIIGGNDIITSVFKSAKRVIGRWKHLPQEPSPEWYRQNLQAIVTRLKNETSAKIGLVSLSEVGEAPNSANPAQNKLNILYKQYNEIIRDIALTENVSYIPFYERLHEQIVASPGKAFTKFRFLPFYKDVFYQFILRYSFDKVAKMNGWQFHIDGVHLNTRGGMILTELVQKSINE